MAPEFQGETPLPTNDEVAAYNVEAKEGRPEVRELYIEAKMNNIDIKCQEQTAPKVGS